MNVLLTGGLGYIGSHAAVELVANGHEIFIYDNLSNSKLSTLEKLNEITGKKITLIKGDILNEELLFDSLVKNNIDVVMHLAGHKSVNESFYKPIMYYHNNVSGSITLLSAMKKAEIRNMIFSSSASVYGNPIYNPIDEVHPLCPINPYAQTKKQIEEILNDIAKTEEGWKFISLRYFNPVGSHDSGLIGEDPLGIPNNLVPYIAKVAIGELPYLKVFGSDYETRDGTGIRDYIHITDLVRGHIASLNLINDLEDGNHVFNLGTGSGVSVLEMLNAFEKAVGLDIKFKYEDRRIGDSAECYADNTLAKKNLSWNPEFSLDDMCESSWKYINMYK